METSTVIEQLEMLSLLNLRKPQLIKKLQHLKDTNHIDGFGIFPDGINVYEFGLGNVIYTF